MKSQTTWNKSYSFHSVQFSQSVVSDSLRPHGLTSLSITTSWSLLKLMSIELVMPSNHLILCQSLLLLPSIFPSYQGLFQLVSTSHQVAKVLEFQFQHQSSGLVSFRTDWFDLLAVHGIFKRRLQHHSSKSSIIPCLAFLYGPTFTSIYDYWKNHSFD